MARKLDIFDLLSATDRRDQGFYERLSEDAKKEFAPPVVLRWASAVDDGPLSDATLLMLNERSNVGFWDISDHPELQYRLIASSGVGRKQRHHWIPLTKARSRIDKLRVFLQRFWPDANSTEIDILLGKFTAESFRAFIEDAAIEPKEAKELMESYVRHVAKDPEQTPKHKGKGKH